jgi:hypothetical protein
MNLSRLRFVSLLTTFSLLLFTLLQPARAGGPRYVAGISYFNPGTAGLPLIWAQGQINYYTDQGNLSSTVSGPQGDALVADAFSQWTSIPNAAVVATHAGQLAEDVNGSNVYRNSDGSITMPADIMPTAVGTPVGVVYDADGTVTDALLGQGAGDGSQCFYNAAYGGIDNFGIDAYFLHALVVINGNCVAQLPDPDVEYRLVRVLGRVLGLGWSQMNLNVQTNIPPPTPQDYVGFSIMHATDAPNCVPISLCYSDNGLVNPYQPKEDDQAALSRLYPAPLFSSSTARIYGNVYFANSTGQSGQGMQGVNVVARWIDPNTNLPSRAYAATSVSGFLFAGNVGTTVTGYNDSTGLPFNRYGSNNAAQEGFFDLAGLQIPNGGSSAQFQLTVETLDPTWSNTVGYQPWQVEPSGSLPPIIVSVNLGGDIQQDILMQNGAKQKADWFGPTNYQSPAPLPVAGNWASALGPYGALDYFWFAAQANRTLAVLVTALDDFGAPTENKSQPVIGMWALADPGTFPAPANTPSAFNSSIFATTELSAQILQTTSFRIGIADIRGDGRPDYRYQARLLYGDHITPARASVSGGTGVAITGIGFQANTATVIGSGGNAQPLAASANQILISAPPQADGVQDLTLIDPPTRASSVLSAALTYGAGPNDILRLIEGQNPPTPVGGQAANPIRVEVVAPDGVTPVAGASVFFTSTPAASFSACGGGTTCTVLTDQSGQASTLVNVLTAGVNTITVQLAPASYVSPQQVQTTLLGTSSALDLSLLSPNLSIAQDATANVALTARVLSNGIPISGRTVNYYLDKGSATLNPPSAKTNASGYATSSLQFSSLLSDLQVSVCVEPGDKPCATFYGTAIPASSLQMQTVAGEFQFIAVGQAFQPLTVRIADNSVPPNPVIGANVLFQSLLGRTAGGEPIILGGDTIIGRNTLPIILGSSQIYATSDANGLASLQPSTGGFQGALAILGSASGGSGNVQFVLQSLWPPNQ